MARPTRLGRPRRWPPPLFFRLSAVGLHPIDRHPTHARPAVQLCARSNGFNAEHAGTARRRIGHVVLSSYLYPVRERMGESPHAFVRSRRRAQRIRCNSFGPGAWSGNDHHREGRRRLERIGLDERHSHGYVYSCGFGLSLHQSIARRNTYVRFRHLEFPLCSEGRETGAKIVMTSGSRPEARSLESEAYLLVLVPVSTGSSYSSESSASPRMRIVPWKHGASGPVWFGLSGQLATLINSTCTRAPVRHPFKMTPSSRPRPLLVPPRISAPKE
jgi:hypothetical protein